MDDWPDNETWNRWKNDPSKWIWGIFYFNREDKRLFVPKRTEWMGVTINFADGRIGTIGLWFFAVWAALGALVVLFGD
jgi:uncharacterized membrane protein